MRLFKFKSFEIFFEVEFDLKFFFFSWHTVVILDQCQLFCFVQNECIKCVNFLLTANVECQCVKWVCFDAERVFRHQKCQFGHRMHNAIPNPDSKAFRAANNFYCVLRARYGAIFKQSFIDGYWDVFYLVKKTFKIAEKIQNMCWYFHYLIVDRKDAHSKLKKNWFGLSFITYWSKRISSNIF